MRRSQGPAICIALLCAAPAGAQEPPAVAAPPPRYRDAAPTGPSAAERLAEVRRRVAQAAVYPPIAREREIEGEALIAFRIGRDGRPLAIATRATSGHAVLDRAAERAVGEAAPLPYLSGTVEVPVRFSLED